MGLLLSFWLSIMAVHAQDYGEYNEYQVFTEGENSSRHWGFTLIPSVFYNTIEEINDVSGATALDRKTDFTLYDIKVGHIFRRGLYLGFLYSGEKQTSNDVYTTNRESFGLSAGYLYKGWTIFAHYYFYSLQKVDYNSATHDEYAKGNGFQIEAGYHFMVTHYFSIGPMINYRSLGYNEAETTGTSTDVSASSTHKILTPMLSMIFTLYR